ncbi:TonB C-terminal domain-containing protein [candidate division KSB1 bacterium]|nr:TonB C-terminal domain-containing protein [candidate division KSB1 bacterium]
MNFALAKNPSVVRKTQKPQNIFRLALLISVLLHLLGVVFVGLVLPLSTIALQTAEASKPDRPPLVFTLAETPESARREKPPENAEHVSDKNAVAQNHAAPQNLSIDKPFAEGALPNATAAPQPSANAVEPEPAVSEKPSHEDAARSAEEAISMARTSSNFRRDFLTGNQRSTPPQFSEAGRENQQSRAPEIGGFSLNTYEWDFAPYMLWLQKHVQRNIYPPPAFTHMGIISGRTMLRFRINRDGTLLGMELLGYDGHKSLMETSVRAVQLSAPFRGLPKDFPEEYLEVTGHFEYTVRK